MKWENWMTSEETWNINDFNVDLELMMENWKVDIW